MISAKDGNSIVDAGAKALPAQVVMPIPQGDKLIIEQAEASLMQGKIIIPENKQERPYVGVVKRIGPGAKNDVGQRVPVEFEIGDTVMFSRHCGYEIEIEGKQYRIMSELDVHCRMPRQGEEGYEAFEAKRQQDIITREKQLQQLADTNNMPGRFK